MMVKNPQFLKITKTQNHFNKHATMPPYSANMTAYSTSYLIDGNCKDLLTQNPSHFEHAPKFACSTVGEKIIKKSVKFAAFDEVIEILHINDMSEDEINNAWFNSEDLVAIRHDCLRVINHLDSNEVNANKSDTRGLERHTKTNSTQKRTRRAFLYDIVYNFQKIAKTSLHGVICPDTALAGLCQRATRQSRQEAEIIGLVDAIAMKRCWIPLCDPNSHRSVQD